jgi:hypothetical protein
MLGRPGRGDLHDLDPLWQCELRRPAAFVPGVQRVKAVGVEIADHITDAVLAGKRHLSDLPAGMPCADSSTICARRQVTTDPLPRRMIRSSRAPSSSSISRTRTRSAMPGVWSDHAR